MKTKTVLKKSMALLLAFALLMSFMPMSFASSNTLYTVTWDVDGEEYSFDELAEGETITPPDDPTKDTYDCTFYTFEGWSEEPDGEIIESFPSISENMIYYAVFGESEVHGTVDGFDYEGNGDGTHAVYCADCNAPIDYSEKCTADKDTHKCKWCGDDEHCKVTFMNGDNEFESGLWPYGKPMNAFGMGIPEPPSGKEWDGWYTTDNVRFDPSMVVYEDVIFYARFKDNAVKYTVTVENGVGNGQYTAGTVVTISAYAPETGKKFAGWTTSDGVTFADSTARNTTFVMTDKAVTVTATYKDIEYVTLKLESPRGLNEEVKIDIEATVADLKAMVAEKCSVTFGGDSEYRLFGEDLSYPNSKLDDDTKVLKDIGFANNQTIHLEKSTYWDSTTEPVKIFGFTITGGKGSQEPYGDYTNVDYFWNYYYKTITIRTDANIKISGTAEENAHIITRSVGGGKYINLTISDLTMSYDAGACITLNSNSWVKLTVEGTNSLTATGENAPYTTNKTPAISLNNSGTYLKIMKASTGTLTATSNVEGQPGIGTYDSTSEVWGVEINGGTIIANGGEGGAGIRASAVCIYGGDITANGGIDAYSSGNALYSNPFEILGGTVIAKSSSQALSKAPYLTNYTYHTAYASTSVDGENTVTYDSTANDTYKYFVVEPAYIYTVKFDKNHDDAIGTMDDQIIYLDEETALAENAFAREGYEFVGWNTKADGTGTNYTDEAVVYNLAYEDESITLYAKWLEVYNIYVAGVKITEENASDVLGDGKVSYDRDTKTLTLNNATVNGTSLTYSAILTMEDITVEVIGTNNLNGYNGGTLVTAGIEAEANVTITGEGTLNVTGGVNSGHTSTGIKIVNGNLVIKDCTVNAVSQEAQTYSVGIYNEIGKITIDSATITAKSGNVIAGPSYGIYASEIELKDASVTAESTLVENGDSLAIVEATLDYEDGYQWKTAEDSSLVTNNIDWERVGQYFLIKPKSENTSRPSSGGGGASYFTVKFETGEGSKIDNAKVVFNKTVTEPEAPEKEGYVFDGWYTDEELLEAYDFETKVTKSFTLYAKWTEDEGDNTGGDKHDCPSLAFDDLDVTEWYHLDTDYVIENKIFKGVTEKIFEPNSPMTRAMMVTVLYRAEGEPATNRSIPFSDIDMSEYYANAVIWAKQNGVVKGISENEFAPDDNITREQIAAIMHRYAILKGYDVSVGENTNILSYDDFDEISEYAIPAMQWAVGSGLIKGKSEITLNPQDDATRAELAAILHRFIEANK